MRVLGCFGFYSLYIKNLLRDSKPFFELKREDSIFKWTQNHEKHFNEIK